MNIQNYSKRTFLGTHSNEYQEYDIVRHDVLCLAVGNSITQKDGDTSFCETSMFIFPAPWHYVQEVHDIYCKCISGKKFFVP
jgi:hypothetical protein